MKRLLLKGFTLIELMIVVAIVAILAAIAIPAYQNYTARAQLTEVMTALGNVKTNVANYIQGGGDPTNVSSLSTGKFGTYVDTITVTNKGNNTTAINAAVNNSATAAQGVSNPEIQLVYNSQANTLTCNSNLDPKYMPSSCTGTSIVS